MQKPLDLSINLAKNRGESLADRLVGFTLTAGRILIILTELIALSAFLYRFTLDQQLVTLHDGITQQEAIVKLLHNNEQLFRSIQDRLALAAALIQQSSKEPKYMTDIISFAPFDMNIYTIAVANDAVRIEALAQSVDSLTTFVNKLKAYDAISNVSIDQISNQTTTGTITVNITATLKKSPALSLQLSQPLPGGQL